MIVAMTAVHGAVPGSVAFCTSQEELNRMIVRRLYEQVANQHNFSAIDEFVDADVQVHSTISNLGPGRSGLQRLIDIYVQQFPERHLELHNLIAAGDQVVVRYTLYVTYHREPAAPAATDQPGEAALNGIAIARLTDQRIVELWYQDDLSGLPGTRFST